MAEKNNRTFILNLYKKADSGKYAIPAINFSTMEIVHGIHNAAIKMKAPIIMSNSEGERGFFGREELVLKWNMIQSVYLQQSIYQEGHDLATVVLNTAGGQVKIPYLTLAEARAIINYALYKVEVQ